MNYQDIHNALKKRATKERKKTNEWFFKTGKGQYGEGDIFIGVSAPGIKEVVREFYIDIRSRIKRGKYPFFDDEVFSVLQKTIESKIHEERLFVLYTLSYYAKEITKHRKRLRKKFSTKKKKEISKEVIESMIDIESQKKMTDFYIRNMEHINNWDLVDCSAHYILGQSILDGLKDISILKNLAVSESLWERRIAIVSQWIFIREDDFSQVFSLAKTLLRDKEDLIQKAVGWMLREAWKKKPQEVESFIQENYFLISRTTLRYAIEKMDTKKRKIFLKGSF